MIKLRSPAICRSRWFTPLICLGLGAVVFAVSALGGQVGGGLISLAILAGFGLIMLLAALVGWLVEVARGHNGHPYDWLLAIGGLAYLVSFVVFRWRG